MPLNINGGIKTRVQANGVYMRTVVSNGTTVFNLNSTWTYLGLSSASVTVTFAGTFNYTASGSTSTGFTLCNQQTANAANSGAILLSTTFPVQNYGGGATAAIPTWQVTNKFGQVARCAIDFGYPPLRYQVTGTY